MARYRFELIIDFESDANVPEISQRGTIAELMETMNWLTTTPSASANMDEAKGSVKLVKSIVSSVDPY